MSFADWMARHYAGVKRGGRDCDQLMMLTDLDGNVIVDLVGRLECVQEDFSTMCNRIGLPDLKVPHKNKTKHEHYSVYYDDETREMVADLYRRDIEYFGYAFEGASDGASAEDLVAGEDRHV